MSDPTIILAVDPGPEKSAYVLYDGQRVLQCGIEPNAEFRQILINGVPDATHLAIEKIECFGMAVGAEVFETVYWTGRFCEAWRYVTGEDADRVPRRAVKLHLCGSARAKDANIRQAILDLFPRTGGGSVPQVGTKKAPGPLFGVSSHVWAALAVGVTWMDARARGEIVIERVGGKA